MSGVSSTQTPGELTIKGPDIFQWLARALASLKFPNNFRNSVFILSINQYPASQTVYRSRPNYIEDFMTSLIALHGRLTTKRPMTRDPPRDEHYNSLPSIRSNFVFKFQIVENYQ